MAFNEKLVARVRKALAGRNNVKEKKMFGALAFMLDDKMCVTVGADQMMFRIDPALHDEVIKQPGCTTVTMGNRQYKGYVHVSDTMLTTDTQLMHWLQLAFDYNKTAKASKK